MTSKCIPMCTCTVCDVNLTDSNQCNLGLKMSCEPNKKSFYCHNCSAKVYILTLPVDFDIQKKFNYP